MQRMMHKPIKMVETFVFSSGKNAVHEGQLEEGSIYTRTSEDVLFAWASFAWGAFRDPDLRTDECGGRTCVCFGGVAQEERKKGYNPPPWSWAGQRTSVDMDEAWLGIALNCLSSCIPENCSKE